MVYRDRYHVEEGFALRLDSQPQGLNVLQGEEMDYDSSHRRITSRNPNNLLSFVRPPEATLGVLPSAGRFCAWEYINVLFGGFPKLGAPSWGSYNTD